MTVDPGIAAIAVAAIALFGAGVGALASYFLDGRRNAAAERRQEARERRARIREHDLRGIDHTRRQVERVRIALIAVRSGKAGDLEELNERADLRLVGDAAAVSAFDKVTQRLAGDLLTEMTSGRGIQPRLFTGQEQQDLGEARMLVMSALDAQERRILADEPPIILPTLSNPG